MSRSAEMSEASGVATACGRPHPVVVAARGSDASFAEVRWAVALADAFAVDVEVLEVAVPGADERGVEAATCGKLAGRLRERLDVAGLGSLDVRCESGDVEEVLLEAARGATAIVVGGHLPKPGHRFAHGHLARDLARRSNAPLLIVPPGHTELPTRVVVGVDGRSGCGRVLDWGVAAAKAFDAVPLAVHVADPLSSMFGRRAVDRAESHAVRVAGLRGVELVRCVGENAAAELVEVAASRSAGLIVAGTMRRHGLFATALGEATERLIDDGTVAVAVVPHDDA